jgi:CheY-like chemotaxis protein
MVGKFLNVMIPQTAPSMKIMVVEDVQETRDAIEKLLKRDGYCVIPARNEDEAVERARSNSPDLILISLGGTSDRVVSAARKIRARADLTHRTPVVIFSSSMVPEGEEWEIEGNIHITTPDNFNQLRDLLRRVLREASRER